MFALRLISSKIRGSVCSTFRTRRTPVGAMHDNACDPVNDGSRTLSSLFVATAILLAAGVFCWASSGKLLQYLSPAGTSAYTRAYKMESPGGERLVTSVPAALPSPVQAPVIESQARMPEFKIAAVSHAPQFQFPPVRD